VDDVLELRIFDNDNRFEYVKYSHMLDVFDVRVSILERVAHDVLYMSMIALEDHTAVFDANVSFVFDVQFDNFSSAHMFDVLDVSVSMLDRFAHANAYMSMITFEDHTDVFEAKFQLLIALDGA
jgi:hypothetical protein